MTRVRRYTLLLVFLPALAFAPSAGHAATSKGHEPFKYTYRITDVRVTATMTVARSSVTSRLRLEAPSKMRWLSWFGEKPRGTPTSISGTALYLLGEATYSSPDASCTGSLQYRSSRSHPVKAVLVLDPYTHKEPKIRVHVIRFPIAVPSGGQDDGSGYEYPNRCGKPRVGWWDDAVALVSTEVMKKPRFTATARRNEKLDPGGVQTIDWTVQVSVERIRYHKINCATESGCS